HRFDRPRYLAYRLSRSPWRADAGDAWHWQARAGAATAGRASLERGEDSAGRGVRDACGSAQAGPVSQYVGATARRCDAAWRASKSWTGASQYPDTARNRGDF